VGGNPLLGRSLLWHMVVSLRLLFCIFSGSGAAKFSKKDAEHSPIRGHEC
jgi:hypothetical protein